MAATRRDPQRLTPDLPRIMMRAHQTGKPMRTTIDIPDQAHRRLKQLAQAKGMNLGTLLLTLSDQALGLNTDPTTGLIRSPVTGFLKLSIGRPVTTAELKSLDE